MKIYSARIAVQSSQNHKNSWSGRYVIATPAGSPCCEQTKTACGSGCSSPDGPVTQPLSIIGSLGMKLEHRIQLHFGMILKCDQVFLQKPWNTTSLYRGVAFFTSDSPTSLPSGPRGTALLPGFLHGKWAGSPDLDGLNVQCGNFWMWKRQLNHKTLSFVEAVAFSHVSGTRIDQA